MTLWPGWANAQTIVSLWASVWCQAVTASCPETAERAPIAQKGRDSPPVHLPADGEMRAQTRNARARRSPVPSIANSSMQSRDCLPVPHPSLQPMRNQHREATHLGRVMISPFGEEGANFWMSLACFSPSVRWGRKWSFPIAHLLT